MTLASLVGGLLASWRRHRLSVRVATVVGVFVAVAAGSLTAWALFSAAAPAQANTFSAAPVASIRLTPTPATVTAGGTQTYTVTAYDSGGVALATVTSAAVLTISPDGSCTSGACTATVAGPHTVTASYWGLSTTATLTVTPGAAAKLGFTQSPSTSSGGAVFATQPVVAVQDTYGNTVTSSTAPLTLSITSGTPASGGPGTLSCTSNPLTAASGVATFAGCSVNTIGTDYRLHAVSGSLTATDSATFSITGGTLASFRISSSNQTAGVAFPVTVTALDSGGNVASGWTSATRCVTFSGPTASPTATAPLYPAPGASCAAGQSALSFGSSGQATATLTLYNAQSTTLTVTSVSTPAGKTGTTGTFTVAAATLSAPTVSSPGPQTAGVAFTVTVSALDTWGNPASGWAGSTTCVTFGGPSSSPGGTAPLYPGPGTSCSAGQSALTFSTAGQASASITLYAAQTTTSLTVTSATAPAGKTGTSGTFAVSAAALFSFGVSTPPAQTAGVSFAVTVSADDTWGNPAAGWTGTPQCVQLSDPASSPNGTTARYPGPGTTGTICAAGFSQLTFSSAAQATATVTLYDAQTTTLSVFDSTLTFSGTSGAFTVTSASPATLTATSGSGQTTTVSRTFTKPLVATVLDAYGNAVPQAAVTFTAPAGGASASFTASGCTSSTQPNICVAITDSTGRATSGALTATATPGTYTLAATSLGLTTSYTETNTANGVLHVSSLRTGASSGTTLWTAPLTVGVTDAAGTPVPNVGVAGAWNPTTVTTNGCTTDATGTCTITPPAGSFPSTQVVETWTVSGLSAPGYLYDAASNLESSLTVGRGCAAGAVCSYDLGSDAFDTTAATSTTTTTLNGTSGVAPTNATVYVLVARDGKLGGDSVSSVSGSAISGPAPVSAITSNLRSNNKSATNLWVYAANGTGAANGTVSVTFNNADNVGTLVQAVVVAGDNTAAATWASGNTSCTASCTASASGSLTSASATDGELLLIAQAKTTTTPTTSSTAGATQMFGGQVSGPRGFTASTWSNVSAQTTTNFTLGTTFPWGVIAIQVPRTN
jgi:hypothetical protein